MQALCTVCIIAPLFFKGWTTWTVSELSAMLYQLNQKFDWPRLQLRQVLSSPKIHYITRFIFWGTYFIKFILGSLGTLRMGQLGGEHERHCQAGTARSVKGWVVFYTISSILTESKYLLVNIFIFQFWKAAGFADDDEKFKEVLNKCSRHRSKQKRRKTPPGEFKLKVRHNFVEHFVTLSYANFFFSSSGFWEPGWRSD